MRQHISNHTTNPPAPQRLQKMLAGAGIASRRHIEKMVSEGRITVNSQVVTEQGLKITPHDRVEIDGKPIPLKTTPFLYIILNKPLRVLSTVKDEHGRKTVRDLLPKDMGRIYPVGRLDYETSGLLLLTNDGNLTLKLTHPRYNIPKTYRLRLRQALDPKDLKALQQGIKLEDGLTRPAELRKLHTDTRCRTPQHWVEMTLKEGRNRQVRRMFEHLGYDILSLERTAYASLSLKDLSPGAYRTLTPREVAALKLEVRCSMSHNKCEPSNRKGPNHVRT
ncbi:MAG: rRNA pseudouridine synthase [Peptococcaceae bacterium]|nr:rRNA pseudouridine synthase [Peptococcaceae bacterium]